MSVFHVKKVIGRKVHRKGDGLGAVKIGVLGGTFNPIHFGHLHIAGRIQALFSLSQVHFVVATMPPHKRPEDLIPFTHRYAMVSLAVAEETCFIPSLVELEPPASPFSIETMHKLAHGDGPDKRILYFIAGGDSLGEVKSWRESEKLLNCYNFVFVVRPGTKLMVPQDALPGKTAARMIDLTGLRRAEMRRRIVEAGDGRSHIYIVDADAPDISATQIRNRISLKKSIRRTVPGPVCEYIRKLHLYGAR
jgi:nicotinate-nucleotide adenylyltransferase